ncbi:CBS domain-containing protein [Desertimonas flava]|uniref:CBS domain-containing protein n=1 Tax=Desertimonas flava TaxID=2064846 RepID=UPI000E35233B|nr:CBS domain-containing protein [Desertimonas flava]
MTTPPITRVDALEAERLIAAGITVFDALPESIWRQERLPGARSQPLESFSPGEVADIARDEQLLVYCFDQHCDLSARMCRRLVQLGFTHVHDLIGGRAAWTAQGLPTEGTVGDRRRLSHYLRPAATVGVDDTIAQVSRLADDGLPTAVVSDDGVLLGALQPTARTLAPDTPVADVMIPAPATIRPELRVEEAVRQLEDDGLAHVFVTAVNGTLLGLAVVAELHV